MLAVRRASKIATAAAALTLVFAAGAPLRAADDYDPWPGIAKEAFAGRAVSEDGVVGLDAPVRAEDAALVPITMRVPESLAARAKSLTLVVEKNPMPVVAKFTFGPAAGTAERMISTRIRVDMYSNVRAVLETDDGKLHMTTKFVKAAGGCSAPALKDADDALAQIGKMQVKTFDTADAAKAGEAQVMIKHPNYSGMQMNQLTGLYIPAKYVRELIVKRGADEVFRMEGGISLSEDPNIRFSFASASDNTIEAQATDTEGKVFTAKSAAKGS